MAIALAVVEACRDLARTPSPAVVALTFTCNTDAVVRAAVGVLHGSTLLWLKFNGHTLCANFSRGEALWTAGRHRAILSCPSNITVACHAWALGVFQPNHTLYVFPSACALVAAVVGAVAGAAVVAAESWVAVARAIHTVSVTAATVRALGVRAIHARVFIIAFATSGFFVTQTVAAAVVGA